MMIAFLEKRVSVSLTGGAALRQHIAVRLRLTGSMPLISLFPEAQPQEKIEGWLPSVRRSLTAVCGGKPQE